MDSLLILPTSAQKHKNNMTGTEFQRNKESQAAIMQEKQRKAEERKAAEAAKK
jgi:hypothetical protein